MSYRRIGRITSRLQKCWIARKSSYHRIMTSVLLAEDDLSISDPLARALRREGYDVDVSADGPSTLDAAMAGGLDLIVLDIGLPGGDGFMVMERLKDLMILTPVIVVSAKESGPNRKRALEAGAQAFFQKPVDRVQFMFAVRRALNVTPDE